MTDPVPSKDLRVYNFTGCLTPGEPAEYYAKQEADSLIERLQRELQAAKAECIERFDQARHFAELSSGRVAPEPEAYYAALNRITVALGNPALSWKDGETIESALIDEAARRLSAPEPAVEHFGFVRAMAVADAVFAQYKVDQPKWWKRMDGTPILNDIAVRMSQAFLEATQRAPQPPPVAHSVWCNAPLIHGAECTCRKTRDGQ